MANAQSIALLGFLPWTDSERGVVVRENPAAIVAERCARELAESGISAVFVPVPVSGEGIRTAMKTIAELRSDIVIALGQTKTAPRVERFGRAPGSWSPAAPNEESPWLLAPDADVLAVELNQWNIAAAATEPFVPSDEAGAYFCDHLCVELVRLARMTPISARFLHITAIDECSAEVRAARLDQYTRQVRAAVDWLRAHGAEARS